jgi:hypothetical protein
MKRAFAVGVFSAIVFAFFVGSTFPLFPKQPEVAQQAPGNDPVTIDISIKPSSQSHYQLLGQRLTPTSYVAAVSVLDSTGHKIFGGATVTIEPGTRQTATGKLRDGEVTLTVALDHERSRAATEVSVTRNGVVVQKQKSDIMLRTGTAQGIIPLQ